MRTAIPAKLAAALLVAAAVTSGGTAHASPFVQAISWSKPQASGGLRFGSNHLNLGFGARGGYTLPQGVYIGGVADYFLGEESAHFFDFGAEGGFDFAVSPMMMVRPFAGLGIASVRVCVADVCESDSATFIELGGIFNYFTETLFYGGELRIISADDSAIVIGGHVGFTF